MQEANKLVASAYKTTESLLTDNREKLNRVSIFFELIYSILFNIIIFYYLYDKLELKVAEALLEKEVLNYNDIEELIGPRPNNK